MTDIHKASQFISTGAATAILPSRNKSQTPITVIGTEKIRAAFLEQGG
jgi:hypothetical protein